jgi:flavin-dependent dehydrogenase
MGSHEVEVDYGRVVSYGIRRCEFDHYLLARAGARLRLGEPLRTLERTGDGWRINKELEARVLVGAGGHFCPVARAVWPDSADPEPVIAAQEIEFRLEEGTAAAGQSSRPEIPELTFTRDLLGYGWVVRKGAYLNIGLGRRDTHALSAHVARFVDFLREKGRIPSRLPDRFKGHAYLLYPDAKRPLAGDAFLLVGDSAGLSYGRSGEGIRPAVESGLLAARQLFDTKGRYDADALSAYARAVENRFGPRSPGTTFDPTRILPRAWREAAAGRMLATRWFAERFVVRRWFLHMDEPPLQAAAGGGLS